MINHITLVWMLSKCTGLSRVINKTALDNLIRVDAKHGPKMANQDITDSRKGMSSRPGMGDYIRSELGSSPIDKVHRICDENKWVMRCEPNMPNIHGTTEHPIQTKSMFEERTDKMNGFEREFYDRMFEVGPGQRSKSVSPPNRTGRGKAVVLDS